jgi:histidinol-phosphatase (PHP family)
MYPVTSKWIDKYCQAIEDAKSQYAPFGLQVFSGVEIDYHPALENDIDAVLNGASFDYVLGAVHSIDGYSIAVPEDCAILFRHYSPEMLCGKYYALVIEALKSGRFDSIAHLDLYKRFSSPIYGRQIDSAHRGIWDQVLEAFASSGAAVEINTGNWRKGLPESSPSKDLLTDLIHCGILGVTVGSDAHHPDLIGCDIQRAYDLAASVGFTRIIRFRKRKPETAVILGKEGTELP